MFRSVRRSVPLLGRWPRLFAAGICLLLALASAAGASRGRPRAPRTVPVVVAARSIPAGTTLASRDLTVARWPLDLRPFGTSSRAGPLIGSRVAGRLSPHEPVTSSRLVDSRLTAGLGPGWAAIPVVLSDAHTADLVHQGDHVELLATSDPVETGAAPGRRSVDEIATSLLVLAVLPADSSTGDDATELILAADHHVTLDITRRRAVDIFTVAVVSP